MRVSLIITTYNWPEALVACLNSVLQQTHNCFEIIVADDGSDQTTADAVREVLHAGHLEWRHVRHANSSIRQAREKNLAARYSTGEYLIFIDHDVVLHPSFVRNHIDNAENGCFLQGKRVFLSANLTRRCLAQRHLTPPSVLARNLGNRKNAIYKPKVARYLSRKKRFQRTLRGCNLSLWRRTFDQVDGYDETFDGIWGREDSDICYRMFHNGIHLKNLWLTGLQYHLDHPVAKRSAPDRLDSELDRLRKQKRRRALCGYSKLSPEGDLISASSKRRDASQNRRLTVVQRAHQVDTRGSSLYTPAR